MLTVNKMITVNIQIGHERLKTILEVLRLMKISSYKELHVYRIFRLCFCNIKTQY